jgi:hypothetical protein
LKAATKQKLAASASAQGVDAISEASRQAAGSLGSKPGLLLAFASGEFDFDASAAAMQDAAGDGAPTAGVTGNGLIGPNGAVEEGCVAIAFGGQVKAAIGSSLNASNDLRTAGRSATETALADLGVPADLVVMLIDSGKGDIADTVAGAYEAAGPAIPLAGGASSGATKQHFHMGEASIDSTIAIAISSAGPIGVGNTQACSTIGTPSLVTRSEGQRLEEIDGRPAEEVYLEQLGLGGVALDDDEFEAFAITHPLAQPELHGEVRLRHVLGKAGGGALTTGTHIPAGAAIEFTELELEQLLESGERSVADAAEALGDAPLRAALVFDCAGRRRALRDGLKQEVEAIAAAAGGGEVPLIGLYTNGEVARLQGAKGDRNHAVVTVALG